MVTLAERRCNNHAQRAAVARCPACSRYCCRECITEHEGRVLCAVCLRATVTPTQARRFRLGWMGRMGLCVVSFVCLWVLLYASGRVLLALPHVFHAGTEWKTSP